jgi:hypothetical protein
MNTGHRDITVIDFRPNEVRVLELCRYESNWQIAKTDTIEVDFTDINEQTLKRILSGFEGSRFLSRAPKISILIPSHLATTRLMNLPPVLPEIMHQAVEFGIKEEYQSDDLRWDSNLMQNGNTYTAFVMAIRESELSGLEKTFSAISRRVEFASTTVCCGVNLLEKQDLPESPEATVILDADSNYTSLTIANSNELLYSRTITKGFEGSGSGWIIEVNQTINYFKSQNPKSSIKDIYIYGTGLKNPEISKELCEITGLPVNKINLKKKLDALWIDGSINPEYSAALGCALGQIKPVIHPLNLIPHRATAPIVEAIEELWIHSAKFVVSVCCILGLLIAGGILSKIWVSNMQGKRLELHQQVLGTIERMKVEQKGLQQVLRERTGWAEFYLFLAETLDQQITLTQINLDTKEGVRIIGNAGDTEQVGNLVKQLNSSKFLKEVRLSQTSMDKGKLNFTLSGKIKN